MSQLNTPYKVNETHVAADGALMASIVDCNDFWVADCFDSDATEIVKKLNGPVKKTAKIKVNEYADAVIILLNMAQQCCGGSPRCAQVLLSLYDGVSYHVELSDVFCNLDDRHTEAALTAIRYRAELRLEPHEMIEDGSKIFAALRKRWPSLHVEKRYKRYY